MLTLGCGEVVNCIKASVHSSSPFRQIAAIRHRPARSPALQRRPGLLQQGTIGAHACDHMTVPCETALIVILLIHGNDYSAQGVSWRAHSAARCAPRSRIPALRNSKATRIERASFVGSKTALEPS